MKVLSTIIMLTALAGHASAEVVDGNKGQLAQGPEIHGPTIEAPVEVEAAPLIQLEVHELIPAKPKPQTEAIPKEYAGEKAVAIKLEELKRDKAGLYLQLALRVINPTDKPVLFTGYSEKAPLTNTQYFVDGKWVDEEVRGICGTGLRQCTVAPGQSAVFQAGLEGEKLPARIGISYNNGKGKALFWVWSEKIER